MSGTSIDSVDAAAVDLTEGQIKLIGSHSHPIPEQLRKDILNLCLPGRDTVQLYAETDRALGELFANAALALMGKLKLNAANILAIGSHGQTIRHSAPSQIKNGYSQQIGDANIIAARTGCSVVADFRRKDIALGGQGAPLVPAFHRQLFFSPQKNRVVANIGGIANITILNTMATAVDLILDPAICCWTPGAKSILAMPMTMMATGALAGPVDNALLSKLKAHPFLAQTTPKSTGREEFNLPWLKQQLQHFHLSPARYSGNTHSIHRPNSG